MNTLIDAWHDEECLYNAKSNDYHNKHLRQESLKRVVPKVRTVFPEVTEELCTKKFNNIRTEFAKEHRKVQASIKSGAGTDDVSMGSCHRRYNKKKIFRGITVLF